MDSGNTLFYFAYILQCALQGFRAFAKLVLLLQELHVFCFAKDFRKPFKVILYDLQRNFDKFNGLQQLQDKKNTRDTLRYTCIFS
jgi:hypothetical protein